VLRTLGVLGNKHIPLSYLRGSEAQRRALLAGILDTDGTVTSTGSIQLAVTSRELAEGVREVVLSLGYRCSMSTKRVKGRSEASSTCYMVNFTTPDRVFWLDRKHLLHKERLRHDPQRTRWRYIVDVRPVPSRPVRCIQVDSADRLYLAGRSMIPTHNSTLALDLARAASLKHGLTTVMFSLEMSRNEITMRLLSAESRVALHAMRTGQMGEEDWTRLARRMSEVADAPLFIDDSPNMSLMEIRAKCRRLKWSRSPSSTAAPSSATTSGPCCRTCASRAASRRRPGCCVRTPVPRSPWGACSRPENARSPSGHWTSDCG
jgi:replicative DNA helicase